MSRSLPLPTIELLSEVAAVSRGGTVKRGKRQAEQRLGVRPRWLRKVDARAG